MKKLLATFFCFSLAHFSSAQNISSVQEQKKMFSGYNFTRESDWDNLRNDGKHILPEQNVQNVPAEKTTACNLNKRVFGWHPYWNGSTYTNYQWNLLSDMCYFDYTVDPNTGNNANGSFAWSSSAAVTAAITNGTNAHFCASLFGSHTTFLGSTSAQQTFITNAISLLNSRGGKGVNIDFEGMAASNKAGFTAFIQNLSTQLKAANPNYEVSIALYAVDWSAVFDIPNLKNYVDLFIIMGYDYYYGGSTTAGPEAPLYNFQTGYNYTLTKSITYYLKQGVPNSKLLLGLPYYGREWSTSSNAIPSATTGSYSGTKTFATVKGTPGTYSAANYQWEPISFNSLYDYYNGTEWRQCWIDEARSMRYKFDVVNQRGIGGIGIWALGYDDGYSDFWNAIKDKFSTCAVVPCSDTLYDMGGPSRNYYDNEDYAYTISPNGASKVSLNFTSFATELNFDSLWLYDGNSTAAPLIGKYTGTTGPGNVTSTGPSITMRFKSDGATNTTGFYAIWNCVVQAPDNIAPTTQVNAPTGWITQTFTTNFTDADNVGGSGLEKRFYNVSEYNGSEWRSTNTRGFFNDNFDFAIHPEWTQKAGTWVINANHLEQTDQTPSNTNIYAPLTQNLSNRFLYHWQGMISGTGTNRRAGLHFFCDQPDSTNRGNNYFVWFRVDQSVVEFYKTTNNIFSLVKSIPQTITATTWYDYKVSYDRVTGEISVWINNNYVGSYTDSSPISTGGYVSFRNGNCDYAVDNFKVYRSRNPSATVTVGNVNTNDIHYQNPSPAQPAGSVSSIVKDSAYNLSTIATQTLNIDWSVPYCPALVNDGTTVDIDTVFTTTQLSANWSNAIDTNSAIAYYEYAIGTSPGLQDMVAFTNNGSATSVTKTGLSLTVGQHYYFTVHAFDGAGLVCNATNSDGVIVLVSSTISQISGISSQILIYPNPNNGSFFINAGTTDKLEVEIKDITGRILLKQVFPVTNGTAEFQSDLPNGTYLMNVRETSGKITLSKFVVNK
ncbi:MAG TPA: glycosyl hydrolase family 18 protein [Bacteroidia bacterium]|jgi:spore germination protein YaaH|nr:glycosyl hydrolase family 18 protein [Bacteroidia bacterium]